MKSILSNFALLLISFPAFAQSSPLEQLILQAEEKSAFTEITVFSQRFSKSEIATPLVEEHQILKLDRDALDALLAHPAENVVMQLPLGSEWYSLKMTEADLFTDDYQLQTSDLENINPSVGQHYRGIVEGYDKSIATISIFKDEVIGMFSIAGKGNFVLGRLGEDVTDDYVLYNDRDLKIKNPFRCMVEEDADEEEDPHLFKAGTPAGPPSQCKLVRMYYEADYDVYVSNGSSVPNTENFIAGMFNSISAIYLNEYINMQISRTFIWTSTHAYPSTSSGDALEAFADMRRDTFTGDLAQLLAMPSGGLGGVAWLNALCRSYESLSSFGPESYVDIDGSYADFPTYSWNIDAMSHELGHNLGSRHTHNCDVWPGGPIDWCGPTYSSSYIEGSCTTGPMPTSGTIMSYCHLVSGVGKDLALGFGPYPQAVIRGRVMNVSCLEDYPWFTSVVSTATVNACVGDSILLTASPSGSIYKYEWFLDGSSIYSGTGSSFGTFHAISGGTYECLVSDTNSCPVLSNSVTLNFLLPNDDISPAGPTTICDGDSLLLSAVNFLDYVWSTGDTTRTIWVNSSDIYSLTVTDGIGCTSSNSTTVTVRPPVEPLITYASGVLSTGAFFTYQWYRDGVLIPGATAANYTPTVNGSYTVVTTDVMGCDGISPSYNLENVGWDDVIVEGLSLYPNPVSDKLYIRGALGNYSIRVYDIEGKLIVDERFEKECRIDCRDWASGEYRAIVENAGQTQILNWVVQH